MAELPRPSVEVIQEFKTSSPTVTAPQLYPCIIGPAFEVLEVQESDGTLNADALADTYEQFPMVLNQSSFPAPRGNGDELNYLEEDIRAFFLDGDSLVEFERDPGESNMGPGFWMFSTCRASMKAEPTVDWTDEDVDTKALGGTVLVLQIDDPARANTTEDIIVNFDGGGPGGIGNLTLEEVVDQINDAAGQDIASWNVEDYGLGGEYYYLRVESQMYGALSSVTVRSGGSANSVVGLGYETAGAVGVEMRAEGGGLRAQDDADGDTTSPWIEIYDGNYGDDQIGSFAWMTPSAQLVTVLGVPQWKDLNYEVTVLRLIMDYGEVAPSVTTAPAAYWTYVSASWINTLPNDGTYGMDFTGYKNYPQAEYMVKPGDILYADGARVGGSAAEAWKVEATRIKLGEIDTALSTYDDDGAIVDKVLTTYEVNTLDDSLPFAPRFFWFMAEELVYADTSLLNTAAAVYSEATNVPEQPGIVYGSWWFTDPATTHLELSGLNLTLALKVDDVWQDSFTKTNTDPPYASVALAEAGLNTLFTGTGVAFDVDLRGSDWASTAINVAPAAGLPITTVAAVNSWWDIDINDVNFAGQVIDGTYTTTATLAAAFNVSFTSLGINELIEAYAVNATDLGIFIKCALVASVTINTPGAAPLLHPTATPAAAGIIVLNAGVDVARCVIAGTTSGVDTGLRVYASSTSATKLGFPTTQFGSSTFVQDIGRDNEWAYGTMVSAALPAFAFTVVADTNDEIWLTLSDDNGTHELHGIVAPAAYASMATLLVALNASLLGDFPYGGAGVAGTSMVEFYEASATTVGVRSLSTGTVTVNTPGFPVVDTAGAAGIIGFTASPYGFIGPAGKDLYFYLNWRPEEYQVRCISDSIDGVIEDINTEVGYTVASKVSGTIAITSPLEGYASAVTLSNASGVAGSNAADFMWIVANGATVFSMGLGRPDPDLSMSVSGDPTFGASILRDGLYGNPTALVTAPIYISYKALRLDVTSVAENPSVLTYDTASELASTLDPLDTDNPLGLGLYFAKLNAPGVTCKGIGVDEISSSMPNGTPLAYTKAFEFLEAEDVYGMAPLTLEPTIHQIAKTHTDYMSLPSHKGERVLFICAEFPDRESDTVVGSGLSANTSGIDDNLIVDSNPSAALQAVGIDPTLPIDVDEDLFVELDVTTASGSSLRNYNVSAVSGVSITFRTTFGATENIDGFFTVTPLTETLINADWSLKVRGTSLDKPGTNPPELDRARAVTTIAGVASTYGDRRVYYVFPDTYIATLGGPDLQLDGYYMCSAITGMVGQLPPQQGHTNYPITGFTGVQGSNDTFSEPQLDTIAGGGVYTIIQEFDGAPLICRHQLSTDLTSIETRELSITKVVDYAAKMYRTACKPFIGRYNITQTLLDTLGTVIDGTSGFCVENGVLIAATTNNLVQDTTQPDRILIDITLEVPYPCNYIRITLIV